MDDKQYHALNLAILEHVNCWDLLEHYGMYRGSRDQQISVECPCHYDIKPSARVYPDTKIIYCYSRRKHIWPLQFVRLKERKEGEDRLPSVEAALDWLQDRYKFKIDLNNILVKEYTSVEVDLWKGRMLQLRGKLPLEAYRSLWQKYDQGLLTDQIFYNAMKIGVSH